MSEVKLLPLPGWVQSRMLADAMNDYARANMEPLIAEIEALRAERDLFRDETIELVRQNGEWQARAEQLAEALLEAIRLGVLVFDAKAARELA